MANETDNVPETEGQRDQWYRFWCSAGEDTSIPSHRFPKKGSLLTDPTIRASLDRAIADGKVRIEHETSRSLYLTAPEAVLATETTIFVVEYDDQAPALFFLAHAKGLEAAVALRKAAQAYADQFPDNPISGSEVFDLPVPFLAAYGLTPVDPPHIHVEDWNNEAFYAEGEGA